MDCPKCRHEQRDEVRCESCGIYFEKFRRRQTKSQSADSGLKNARRPPESGVRNTLKIVCLTSAVIGLGLLVYTKLSTTAQKPPIATSPPTATAPPQRDPTPVPSGGPGSTATEESQPKLAGLAAQLAKSNPPGNII